MAKNSKTVDSKRRGIVKFIFWLTSGFMLFKFLRIPDKNEKILLKIKKNIVPVNGAIVFKNLKTAIINQEGKTFALSISCTHLGCTLNISGNKFICPCHGSEFDLEGRVIKGPAMRDLKQLSFSEHADRIVVYEA